MPTEKSQSPKSVSEYDGPRVLMSDRDLTTDHGPAVLDGFETTSGNERGTTPIDNASRRDHEAAAAKTSKSSK